MKLVYGITVSTEKEEVLSLINFLKSNCDDQIVVQIDSTKNNDDLFYEIANLTKYVYIHPFNNDFSEFKNKLNESCLLYGADYIFQLDADEMITSKLVNNIKQILINDGNDIDLIYVPRVNRVDGITQEHINKWKWYMDVFGRINYPDYQGRIYRSNLKWVNKIHERIDADINKVAYINHDDYHIVHNKTIQKQEQQNNFYQNLNA